MDVLRCYLTKDSDSAQAEWILSDFLLKMFESTNVKKLWQRWSDLQPNIKSLHERVFPGFEFPEERVPKKNRKGAEKSKNWEDLVDERTIPTSTLVVASVLLSTHNKRNVDLKKKACHFLRKVADQICQASSGITGDHGIKVDPFGYLLNPLWNEGVETTIFEIWDSDLLDHDAFWVQSSHEKPHIVDVIVFSFRPAGRVGGAVWKKWERLKEGVQDVAHALIKCLVNALHKQLPKLTVTQGLKRKALADMEAHKPKKLRKKYKVSSTEAANIIADVISKLYQNEVPRFGIH